MTVDECIKDGICGLCEGSKLMAGVGFQGQQMVVTAHICAECGGTGLNNPTSEQVEAAKTLEPDLLARIAARNEMVRGGELND